AGWLAVRVVRRDGRCGPGRDRPEFQERIAAGAKERRRRVEGRRSGGFRSGPPPLLTRGPGDRGVSPDVRIAAAKIEKQAAGRDTPSNTAALGVAYLVLGETDRAIDLLGEAAERMPTEPDFQIDLARSEEHTSELQSQSN